MIFGYHPRKEGNMPKKRLVPKPKISTSTFSILDWIKAATALANLWKGIVAMIEAIEETGATGSEKKAAVLAWIEMMIDTGCSYVPTLPALKPFIMELADTAIDAIVATWNRLKLFKHKAEV